MIVHRAVIHSPDQLREWARKDRYDHRRASRHHRPSRERDLAQLGDWLDAPVGLCVEHGTSSDRTAGSEATGANPRAPVAAPPDPAVPPPGDWRLGPNFPTQRRAPQKSGRLHRRPPGQWASEHERCIDCGTTKRRHYGHGRCWRCYFAHRDSPPAVLPPPPVVVAGVVTLLGWLTLARWAGM